MLFVVWIPLVLQLLVAVGLLAWHAFARPTSRAGWLLRTLLVAGYLAATGVGGLWLVLPWYTPVIYAGLFVLAVLRSVRCWRSLPTLPTGFLKLASMAGIGVLAAAFVGIVIYVLSGWRTPPGVVELSFPLRNGTYLVVNCGGNALINAHYKTLEGQRFRPWRGQSYGVDVEKLNRLGFRARGLLPKELTSYEIFGEPLYAPCDGEVIIAIDGVDEMTPPQLDPRHMAGNHVILRCGRAWVLLGHLQKGSVEARTGQRLAEGQRIGLVGNTGNTGEPHLHIHAQLPGTENAPLSGEPLPIRFDRRYPVRSARIKAPLQNPTRIESIARDAAVASAPSTEEYL